MNDQINGVLLFSKYSTKINFAHRTFRWDNEAKGMAAVHVVIIGFSSQESTTKMLFDYENIKGEPQLKSAKNINPYLLDSADVLILPRKS